MRVGIAAALALLSVTGIARTAMATGALNANGYLFAGQGLVAPGCYSHLDMQADGNLVVYHGRQAAWATNTVGSGAYAVMQPDGNFVVYNWGNQPVFASNTNNGRNFLSMQDDGNLVVYNFDYQPQWASNTKGESLGQSPCGYTEKTTSVELNTNRYGGDYASQQIVGRNWPEACAYWCAQDSRCVAYTHVPMGVQGPNAVCWLKSSVPPASGASGLTSGVVHRQ